jgi:hypothetical protein
MQEFFFHSSFPKKDIIKRVSFHLLEIHLLERHLLESHLLELPFVRIFIC